jgi:CheY-like chemotaxis protein
MQNSNVNKAGPVIIIEDDLDDQEMLAEVFKTLGYANELIFFSDGQAALDFLNKTEVSPFLILSDINLPKLDGFALRNKIKLDEKLQVKCIPYLFFSTAVSQSAVINAYSASVQGFFVKPTTISELEETITVIMKYWSKCSAPNNFSDNGFSVGEERYRL